MTNSHKWTLVTIASSTISGNSTASTGGGLILLGASPTIVNSTISGNSAAQGGGGIFGRVATMTIRHSTITANTAGQGSGGIQGGQTVVLDHSIVAGNLANNLPHDLGGSTVQAHYSLIGTNANSGLAEAPIGLPDANGNLIGGPTHGVIDPLLGELADNGGPTLTHAHLAGSPAINAGDLNAAAGVNGVPLFDQRGEPFDRIVNGRIDIGAFEYQSPSDLNLLVDTLVDESDGDFSRGDLSLREAIELANLWSSDDTIRFDQALADGAIVLKKGGLKITDDVSMIGLGAEKLTIDASGNDPTPDQNNGDGSRIFDIVDSDGNSLITVSLAGLTLTGGDAHDSGGAITARENLILTEMSIVNNAARESGGGVYFIDENFSLQNTFEVCRSTISGNNARTGAGVAVRMDLGTMTFADNLVSANEGTGNGSGGSGIYARMRNAPATIVGTTVRENSANVGGGIWASNVGVSSKMLIQESHVVGNTATNAQIGGGGIFLTGDGALATIRNSVIESNTATGPSSHGGGILSGGDAVLIEGSRIANNTSGRLGGGISNTAALTVRDTEVVENSAINNGSGGGISHIGRRKLEIIGSTIRGNSATVNAGGIYVSAQSNMATIDRSEIRGNSAASDGGAVFVQDGRLQLNNSTVAENLAGRDGGAILLTQGAATISNTTISGNVAGKNGGGITSFAYGTILVSSTLSQNRATLNGGAIWADDKTTLSHTTIAMNQADQLGGGVFLNSGNLALNNTVIALNAATFGTDLSGLLGASIDASYSLIGSSEGSGLTPALVGFPDENGNIIGYSDDEPIDPLLDELSVNGGPTLTHRPMPGSPLINAGNPAAMPGESGVPLNDQRGAPFSRVYGGRIDIGAVELQPLPGDYNNDGAVDAADYVAWRKLGSESTATSTGDSGSSQATSLLQTPPLQPTALKEPASNSPRDAAYSALDFATARRTDVAPRQKLTRLNAGIVTEWDARIDLLGQRSSGRKLRESVATVNCDASLDNATTMLRRGYVSALDDVFASLGTNL